MLTDEQKLKVQQFVTQNKVQPAQTTSTTQNNGRAFFDKMQSDLDREEATKRLAQTTNQPKEEFLSSLAKNIVKPFAEVGTSVVNLGESAYDLARGDTQGASEAINKTRNVPFLGETKPAFTGEESTGEAAKKMLGYGAEIGSWMVGGGGAKAIAGQTLKGQILKGLGTGAKVGAEAGLLAGGGRAAQEGGSLGGIAVQGTLGAAGGAVLGGTIGAAAPAVVKGVQKVLEPIESKVGSTLREAIDKGIKPTFKGVSTPEASANYYKKAEEAFKIIKQRTPEIMDEATGEKIARSPQNRKELLDALVESKKQIYNEYHTVAQEAGGKGAEYNPTNVLSKLDEVGTSKKYSPEIRKYAEQVKTEISELAGESPEVVEARIQDLNSSLAGYYEGRINKAKAQVDASVASLMRKELDGLIEQSTGKEYQALKNQYSSLKTIENDLVRQINIEARKNPKGLIDFTDIFSGGDLVTGLLTANPGLVVKGAAMRGMKEWIKALNDPNRYIKAGFDILDKAETLPAGSNMATRANEFLKSKAGLTIEDVSKQQIKGVQDLLNITEEQAKKIIDKNSPKITGILDDLSKGAIDENSATKQIESLYESLKTNPAVGETALIQEAKKYKSAEEFVKAKQKDIVYHGSNQPLEKFDSSGAFFSDDMMNADGYGNGENLYEGFLDLKNPLIIDAKGRHHADLITKYGKTTQEVVQNVNSKKYDGVIFKNINDSFADDVDIVGTDTIFYTFNAEKSFINESQLTDIWNKANKN